MSMITNISTLSGNTDTNLIGILIDKTKNELSSHGATYNASWDNVIEDIVLVKLNRINYEGVNSYTANGMHETFNSGYPEHINKQLTALGLPVFGVGSVRFL